MRMSWASDRVTTREEDRACSLMGILKFGVNLLTIFGEGSFAFIRLQEEYITAPPKPDATSHTTEPINYIPRAAPTVPATTRFDRSFQHVHVASPHRQHVSFK